MKYFIDYQYLPKGAERPLDDGAVVDIQFEADAGSAVIPNVGDYVEIIPMGTDVTAFSGKVRSRLFRHFVGKDESNCAVNIIVEESDDDWGKLVKE